MFDVRSALPRVPRENVGVPWDQFAAAWERAEQLADDTDPGDGYTTGLVLTFRWLARCRIHAPVTRRGIFAMPETIWSEMIAANERIGQRRYPARLLDVARGTADVLSWVWGSASRPPALAEPDHRASTGSSS